MKSKFSNISIIQGKSILELIHQFIANLTRIFDLQNNYLDEDDPWADTIVATASAV